MPIRKGLSSSGRRNGRKITAPLTGQVSAASASELSGIIADAAVVDPNGKPTGAYVPYVVTGVNTCAGITHDPVLHQRHNPQKLHYRQE